MTEEKYDFSQMTVVLADQNRFMRNTVSQLLRSFGFKHIIECDDGADAFVEMRSSPVDLIICDAIMAPLDGIDFTKLIRQAKEIKDHATPIIMLTGHSEQFRVKAARDIGVSEFLVKPISASTLWKRLIHIVEQPRSFVEAQKFTGPDRRRHSEDEFNGADRRGGGGALSKEEVDLLLNREKITEDAD